MTIKKEWQLRYEHARDILNSQCESLGIKVPEETYGTIKNIPDLWREFKGPEFWSTFGRKVAIS